MSLAKIRICHSIKIPSILKSTSISKVAVLHREYFFFENLVSIVGGDRWWGERKGKGYDPDLALEQNSKVLSMKTRKKIVTKIWEAVQVK